MGPSIKESEMLIGLRNFFHFRIMAQDGEIGRVAGFHFDDQQWNIRYLVVETGGWLGRRVLLSPSSVLRSNRTLQTLSLTLDRNQVRDSPSVEAAEIPISRQKEREYHDYYRWPYYWTGAGVFGTPVPFPALMPSVQAEARELIDPHLAATDDVAGYKIHASDGSFGSLDDLVVNDRDWRIQYLVIDTRRWLPGKNVLLQPEHVRSVDWDKREIQADLTSEEIKKSPPIAPDEEIDEATDRSIRDYYARFSVRPVRKFAS